MIYSIFDTKGLVGEYANTRGMMELHEFFDESGHPVLKSFVDNGYYEDPALLREALDDIGIPFDDAIAFTLKEFKELVDRCNGIVIISDGFEEE